MLVVEGIHKKFAQHQALNQVHFALKKGQITALLGLNGAGKSTTMKILVGSLVPDGGRILYDAAVFDPIAPQNKAKIGFLQELNPLYEDLSLSELIYFLSEIYGLALPLNKNIQDYIDVLELRKFLHRPIHQLSKGYKQRVGLLQAVLHDPAIVVLDEPTNGLDPQQIFSIRQFIRSLAQKNKIVLLSTHILSEVSDCDHVIVLQKGQCIYDQPHQSQKNIYVAFEQSPDWAILQAQFAEVVIEKNKHCASIATEDPVATKKKLALLAQEKNWLIVEMREQKNDLEALFYQLNNS